MLHVELKEGVTVAIGTDISITVSRIRGRKIKLGIHAPIQLKITRSDYKPKVDSTPLLE